MSCIFCKITAKEVKSMIVHEDDKFLVIKDISPQAPTHLLILPKAHYSSLVECGDMDMLGGLLNTARTVAKEIGVDKRGFRLIINTNEEGGQTVFHLHMHLLAGRVLTGKMG
jgi:histidine triad (HIT) family protein